MSELLPTVQAANVQASITDFLTTTFALSDPDVRSSLDSFLSSPETGMFKGPYVRTRLPFQPAADGWEGSLEWQPPQAPYGHQAAAYSRLASQVHGPEGPQDRRPVPTLVVTGTGSGKTEAFLHPILDHVRRTKRRGIAGVKALLLYPMNALANDQAARLTRLITGDPELNGVTAGLYTGEQTGKRSIMSPKGLINDREVMRADPPDILLTNYKMLDQLLLRAADATIWRRSALSLQYLVLDEFHTYDGAQGTDVAMLLRRLGLVLKSHWPADAAVTLEDRERPLGIITSVATSATLGDKRDPSAMRSFAQDVFGEEIPEGAVITETRLPLAEWVAGAAPTKAPVLSELLDVAALNDAVHALGHDPHGADLAATVLSHLYGTTVAQISRANPAQLLDLARAHPLVEAIAEASQDAVALADLASATLPDNSSASAAGWQAAVAAVVAMLGHVRSVAGRGALSVEVHLWVRELTRVDRAVQSLPEFRWGDDGPVIGLSSLEATRPSLPAIYCRHCGRSGWMVAMAPTSNSLQTSDETIRADHAAGKGRTLALLHAPREATDAALSGEPVVGLRWFAVKTRELRHEPPGDDDQDALDGWTLPVLTTLGQQGPAAVTKDTCPSCAQEDGIRFLGSAIATLLSVSLSTLFGSEAVDGREKRALVFTDSVQDAAHRAGFVQARSHALTFRSAVREAVHEGEVTLDELPDRMLTLAGDDLFARYRLLHPDLSDDPRWVEFWRSRAARATPAALRRRVRRRLACDVALEAGLTSRVGRTLEMTGAIAIGVDAGPASRLAAAAKAVLGGFALQGELHADGGLTPRATADDAALVAWVRGVLERMRGRGAIEHPWFETYRKRDGKRYSIWGGRPRGEGAPAFPNGRQAPAFPRVGGSALPKESGLDPVTSPQSWYSLWAARVLGVTPADGGALTKLLLAKLVEHGVLSDLTSETAATVYALPPHAVVLSPTTEADLAAGRHLLVCDVCQTHQPGSRTAVDQLQGRPCSSSRCPGFMRRERVGASFYRRLYASPDMRRVVAREHTSLLRAEDRVRYETAFKASDAMPSDPNVLVATPTLEMGIDIGDLSTVFLSSLPKTVASYLQRVGRAGRLTGNALDLAYVTGRGDQLPRLGDPLSVINGSVRPPATYLNAAEILRRQLAAHLADRLAVGALTGASATPPPLTAHQVMSSVDPGSYLGDLIASAEAAPTDHARRFCATFAGAARPLPPEVVAELEAWLTPDGLPRTSPFAAHVIAASGRWTRSVEELKRRATTIEERLPDFEAKADHPAATKDDNAALRSARTAVKVIHKQLADLRGEHWVSVLEEHGVFPNYTLLDDGVTLDVGVTWVNPDTDQFESTPHSFRRGAGQAIREFAPGATFYANGLEIPIDAVDLGVGAEGVRPWVFCAGCGYAADSEASGEPAVPSTCPRCQSSEIADAGQKLPVLELRKVTAEVRRDDASISDRSDERDRTRFQVVVGADVDPAEIADRWYVDGAGLGCTLLRSIDIRWTNLGLPGRGGTHAIAGNEAQAGLFRVCEGCGKLDGDSGTNKPHEHRPWCRFRTAAQEHTVTVALSRTLTTQGLLLRLPRHVTVGDQFAVPSVAAALLLGLQEEIGGHPDHLAVQHIVEPDPVDGGTHEALLLHDVVPGGTGYLTDLAVPEKLRGMLVTAFRRVTGCGCRDEARLACHRCLLPFALSGQVRSVSRAAAERHLRTLLAISPDDDADAATASDWTIVKTPPQDVLTGDSVLEQRFYALVRQRLGSEGLGMAVQEVPGPKGNSMHFTGGSDRRTWTLAPQVPLLGSVPDFVLSCSDANVPEIAIFVDGRQFHASLTHVDVMHDDAGKRETLRLSGRSVIAVTSKDLDSAEQGVSQAPSWFSAEVVARAMQLPSLQAPQDSYARLGKNVLDQLVAWVQAPGADDQSRVARSVPLFLMAGAAAAATPKNAPLEAVAASALSGEVLPEDEEGSRTVFVWREGAVAAAITVLPGNVMALALVLDDRPGAVDDSHGDAWRRWLELSNVLSLRDWPTTITTLSRVASAPDVDAATGNDVPTAWRSTVDSAHPGAERDLVVALSAIDGLPVPKVGLEGPEGIPLDLAFEDQKIAVLVAATDDDVRDLHSAGWTVVEPDVDAVVAAVIGEE